MDKLLLNLSPYGPDHHSREIASLFHIFIRNNFPCLPVYLKSRIIQTKYVEEIEKGVINTALVTPGISTASFWLGT